MKAGRVNQISGGVASSLATTGSPVDISGFAPPDYTGQVLSDLGWVNPFAMHEDWGNAITDYSASGILTATTTASSTSAGALTVYLADASTFKASQGISIVGAGAAGIDHTTTIASVNTASNYVVLNVATVTTVGAGAVVYHDDGVALQSMYSDSAKYVGYKPPGSYIISKSQSGYDAILAMTKMGKVILGNGFFTGGRFYNNQWAYGTPNVSAIYVRNATTNAIHMGSSGTTIKGITILNHSTITPTAGAAIACGVETDGGTVYESSSANYTRDMEIENVEILGCYDGIVAWQDFQCLIDKTNCIGQKRYGLHINRKVPYGGDTFTNMAFAGIGGGAGTGAGAAIYVSQSDWNQFGHIHSNANKYGFYHNLSVTAQGQQIFTSLVVDQLTTGGYGVYINGAATQAAPDIISLLRVNGSGGTGSWYLGSNSVKNILKTGFTSNGGTNTNTGTSNDVSGISII